MAAYTGITLPNVRGRSNIQVLSAEQTRQTGGFTHAFTVPYTLLNVITGGTTGDTIDVQLGVTPGRFIVTRALIDVTTAWATNGSSGTITASLGISTSTAVYVAAQNMLVAGPKAVTAGAVPAGATSTTGATSIIVSARFTTGTAGVLTDITAGSVTFYLAMLDLSTIDG